MKKRIALFLIALCFIFPSAFLLSGCFGSSEHYRLCFYVDGREWQSGPARNEVVNMPSDPQLPDHIFKGWFLDEGIWEQPFNENSLLDMDIKSDINVYAWLEYHEDCYWDEWTSNGDGTHTLTCSRHGEKTGEPEPCSAQQNENKPNCKNRGWCEKCHEQYGEILDHNYVGGVCTMCSQPEYSTDLIYTPINNGESYEVTLNSGLTSANGDNGIRIPSSYNGKPVTRIGDGAFRWISFDYINIPETITEIGDEAFYGVGPVENIKIPNSVVSIGKNAFSDDSFTIEWGDNPQITEIGEKAFYGYRGENLTIPSSVTKIGKEACAYCSFLLTCTIPSSVTEISKDAFLNCRVLTIYCEATEKPADWEDKWYDCRADDYTAMYDKYCLNPVVWNCKENNVADDGYQYVVVDGLRYGLKDGEAMVAIQSEKLREMFGGSGKVTIPATITYNDTDYTVTKIGNASFTELWLTECILPETITSIGHYAFFDNEFTTMIIPDGVTSIGNGAFQSCNEIETITMPTKLKTIGKEAFGGCSKIQEFKLSSTIQSIGNGAFQSCKAKITWLDTPTITALGEGAFSYYEGTTLTIPQSVKTIGDSAFECSTTTINWGINPQVTSLGKWVFSGYENKSLTIPNSVTQIGQETFWGCKAETLYMSTEITVIEAKTFGLCTSNIVWGNTKLKTIGDDAFEYYEGTTLTIPASVETIGERACDGCLNLTTITFENGVKSIGNRAFAYCKNLTTVSLPNSLTSIGYSAFTGCEKLTTVSLPNSLTDIAENIFRDCKALENVTLGNGIKTIGYGMFSGTAITQIILPNSIEEVDVSAFEDCKNLKSVTFPSSVKNFGDSIFEGCTALESVIFPETVEMFSTYDMFSGCSALKTVTMPKTITSEVTHQVGRLAIRFFKGCSSLTSIVLPSSMVEIGDEAFSGCSSLVSVTGSPLSHLWPNAFRGCSSLRELTLSNNVNTSAVIGNNALLDCTALTLYMQLAEDEFYVESGSSKWNAINSAKTICCPVVWDCDNNNVADDGYIYTFIDDIRYGIKNNKAYIMTQSSNLTEITLHASVTYNKTLYEVASAVQDAFKYCKITKVSFDDAIPNYEFSTWQNLTSIEISNKITEISSGVFANCTNLTKVYIASSVESIGENAFDGCTGLTDVYFEGTEDQWNEIVIASGNDILSEVTIHYESTSM